MNKNANDSSGNKFTRGRRWSVDTAHAQYGLLASVAFTLLLRTMPTRADPSQLCWLGTARFGLRSHDSFNHAVLCRTVLARSCECSIGLYLWAVSSVARPFVSIYQCKLPTYTCIYIFCYLEHFKLPLVGYFRGVLIFVIFVVSLQVMKISTHEFFHLRDRR